MRRGIPWLTLLAALGAWSGGCSGGGGGGGGSDGRVWSVPDAISAATPAAARPELGVDMNGIAVAVFLEAGRVASNRYPAGLGGWRMSAPIDSGAQPAGLPDVGVASFGEAVAAWSEVGQ